MPMYSFKCSGCGREQTIVSSIRDYSSHPNANCTDCHAPMVRNYKVDAPQPAPMWPEHFNPATGTVVRTRKQMQSDLDRKADEQFERTGIPSKPVVVDRADMESFRAT